MNDREAFEKWAQGKYLLAYNNGKYTSRDTQRAWEAWQAALQHAGQGEPVAWISEIQCLGAGIYGKRLYGALPIQSLQPGYYKHIPLYKHPQPAVQHAVQGEAARETLASWMLSRGFSTGHGESVTDLLAELDGQVHPQPAVPDEKKRYSDSPYEGGYADGWNACRKALLSAGKED